MLKEDENGVLADDALLARWADDIRDRILHWHPWTWSQDILDTLTWPDAGSTTTGSILYLPWQVGSILTAYPNQLSDNPVTLMTRYEFDTYRLSNTAWRAEEILVQYGYYGVQADNPSAGTLTIASSGTTNAATVIVRIEGRDANNEMIEEVVTLDANGDGTSSNTYAAGPGGVSNFELDKDSLVGITNAGTITLTRSGTTLQRLNADISELRKEHHRTEMFGGAGAYTVSFQRRYRPLQRDTDLMGPIPNEFSSTVELGMLGWLAFYREELQLRQTLELEFRQRLKELQAFTNRKPGHKWPTRANRQWGRRRSFR